MEEKKEEKKNWFKELLPYVIILLIVIIIRTFIITPVRVDGASMDPTLEDGEILLLEKYNKNFERFDIVVFDYNKSRLIKRIIGLPGEYIQYKNNELYVNDEKISENFKTGGDTVDFNLEDITCDGNKEEKCMKIPDNYYLVLGDNRDNSTDSRIIGLIPKKLFDGRVVYSVLPFKGVK